MDPALITLLLFGSMLLLLATGLPIAIVMGSLAIAFTLFLWGPESLVILQYSTLQVMRNFIFVAIPLFIFMGLVLQRSGLTDQLFHNIHAWAGGIRGALGMGTIGICALIAAMVGIASTATVSMGIIAVPAMLKRGYDKRIAVGLVMAGGALGFLIPPSIIMILYSVVARVPVGKLFAGGVFPGLLLATIYIVYIGLRCYFQPHMGPAIPLEERATWKERVVSLKALVLPIILVFLVLGLIFFGLTSPTEASAVGAFGAVVCAAINRKLNWSLVMEAGLTTFKITGMVAWITVAALMVSHVYTALGAAELVKNMFMGLEVNRWLILIIMQMSFFILGMILDDLAILFICMPIYVPIIVSLSFDPIWFAVLYIVNLQMAYITPPYGLNLFFMKGVAPPEVTLSDIYLSVIPFVGLQALGLVIIMIFPQIVLFLPNLLFGS